MVASVRLRLRLRRRRGLGGTVAAGAVSRARPMVMMVPMAAALHRLALRGSVLSSPCGAAFSGVALHGA